MKPFTCSNPACPQEICLTNGIYVVAGNLRYRPTEPVVLVCDTCGWRRKWIPNGWTERERLDISAQARYTMSTTH